MFGTKRVLIDKIKVYSNDLVIVFYTLLDKDGNVLGKDVVTVYSDFKAKEGDNIPLGSLTKYVYGKN